MVRPKKRTDTDGECTWLLLSYLADDDEACRVSLADQLASRDALEFPVPDLFVLETHQRV